MNLKSISKTYPLILASSSPRRKRILKQIGVPFRIVTRPIDENQLTVGHASAVACLLAERKAAAVSKGAGAHWILGADTVVVSGGKILGKPSDRDQAGSMLSSLCGREHKVITGFCILAPGSQVAHLESVTTLVRMKPLTPEEIEAYLDTGEPFGKAGSYAIQRIGAFLVESISGSYTNVVGLPVCALIKALLSVRALRSFPFPPAQPEA